MSDRPALCLQCGEPHPTGKDGVLFFVCAKCNGNWYSKTRQPTAKPKRWWQRGLVSSFRPTRG